MDVKDNNVMLSQHSPTETNPKNEARTDGVLNTSLEKFLQLKKRREELSQFAQFKLSKIEEKEARQSLKNKSNVANKEDDAKDTMQEQKWNDVRKYIDINAHLTGAIEHDVWRPKSGLEEKMNNAIEKKDFQTAEKLSDQLATREFAVRINSAFAAKRCADADEIKKEVTLRKKQKRIAWGFQTKQRWEMKGNM